MYGDPASRRWAHGQRIKTLRALGAKGFLLWGGCHEPRGTSRIEAPGNVAVGYPRSSFARSRTPRAERFPLGSVALRTAGPRPDRNLRREWHIVSPLTTLRSAVYTPDRETCCRLS